MPTLISRATQDMRSPRPVKWLSSIESVKPAGGHDRLTPLDSQRPVHPPTSATRQARTDESGHRVRSHPGAARGATRRWQAKERAAVNRCVPRQAADHDVSCAIVCRGISSKSGLLAEAASIAVTKRPISEDAGPVPLPAGSGSNTVFTRAQEPASPARCRRQPFAFPLRG